jgi:hypothetical protein
MAITRTQKIADTRVGGAASDTVSLTGVAAGALLVLTAACWSSSWDGTTVVTGGGTWATPPSPGTGEAGTTADGKVFIRYCAAATGGSTTVTFNPNGAACDIDLTLSEYAGGAASPADVSPSAATGSSAAAAIASGTLAQADELIVAIASHTNFDTTWTADGTYTQIGENESNIGGQTYHAQDKIVTTTTSDTADWTLGGSRDWFAALATFKADTGGGGGTTYKFTRPFRVNYPRPFRISRHQ